MSREHVIADGPGGMITVAGGKLTTYRLMAATGGRSPGEAAASNEAAGAWPADAGTERRAAARRRVGAASPRSGPSGIDAGFDVATVEHMLRHYGTEAAGIFNLMRSEPGAGRPAPAGSSGVSRRGAPCGPEGVCPHRGRRPGAPNSPVLRDPGPGRAAAAADRRASWPGNCAGHPAEQQREVATTGP